MFISDDGNIDYPVASIQRIIEVSYGTAKNIKLSYKNGQRADKYKTQEEFGHAFIDKIHEHHWWTKIMVQKYDKGKLSQQKLVK